LILSLCNQMSSKSTSPILQIFFENTPTKANVLAECESLPDDSTIIADLLSMLNDTLTQNFDTWVQANKEVYAEVTKMLKPATPVPAQIPTNPTTDQPMLTAERAYMTCALCIQAVIGILIRSTGPNSASKLIIIARKYQSGAH